MPPREKHTVVIAGCGNLAWHLSRQLAATGRFEIFVHNHRPNPALRNFSSKLKCRVADTLEGIRGDAAYYFLCVPDEQIAAVAAAVEITNPRAVLMHCSGSLPVTELGEKVYGTGVFYPLQTFTSGDDVNWSEVPLILESHDTQALARMHILGGAFTTNILTLTYEQRLTLHLSAVLVSNFPNALYTAGGQLLEEKELSFSLLLPLIRQTTSKLALMPPEAAQTGPAKRGDKAVLRLHRRLLSGRKTLAKVYRQLSRLIEKQQRP